ncbi:MAG: hypothetical protein ABWZ86_07290 [Hyphomicrobium sp.]
MTKMTLALAAALIAGTTMTSAANAGGVRLGFGFPLGSFVAHSNEAFDGGYRRSERPRYVRRDYQDDAPVRKIAKIKRPQTTQVAEAAPTAAIVPAAPTAKLESKLPSDTSTTTVIEKTPASKSTSDQASTVTTASVTPDDTKTAAAETKRVCRRYVPAIAALVDVPCE